jgi:transposase
MSDFLPASSLDELTRAELIALVLKMDQRIDALEAELAALREQQPPATTSRNSSLPPAREPKARRAPKSRCRRRGAKPGHAKMERALVEKPDRVIPVRPSVCHHCTADLREVEPEQIIRHQVTEVPEIRAWVLETQQYEVLCPACGRLQREPLPEGLEAERCFGPRLEATLTYFKHEQHLSYERLEHTLRDVFGVDISQGGATGVLRRAGQAAAPQAEAIGAQVCESAVIRSDETSARVEGDNWWEWTFRSATGIYHTIQPSRGTEVIREFLRERDRPVEVWVSDCLPAQLKAPAKQFQLCLAHQVRDLQGVIDRRPRLRWAQEMQALFREAMHLAKRRDRLTRRGFKRRVTEIERRRDRLLTRQVTKTNIKGDKAASLLARYRTHREHLFVFLHRSDVPFDNNGCERALRPSVIHRKVIGGFRSAWGAQTYAALATVIDTAKLHGRNVFTTLVELMGKPILPYFAPEMA